MLIGDSCTDQYKIGTVDRLSPEAPVPVVKIIDEYNVPGMAANVFVNLETLELQIDFVTNTEKILKTRYIDARSGQHLLRVDTEPELVSFNLNSVNNIEQYDSVVISDYNKGFLTYEHIESIIDKTSKPVFIDTKKQDLSRFSRDNVFIKINELEYRNSTSLAKNIIVTLGSSGAMYLKNNEKKLFSTKKVEVTDVCGCGDTFLSALTYQYLISDNIESAIDFANRAASVTVQHRGNYAPRLKEIL